MTQGREASDLITKQFCLATYAIELGLSDKAAISLIGSQEIFGDVRNLFFVFNRGSCFSRTNVVSNSKYAGRAQVRPAAIS